MTVLPILLAVSVTITMLYLRHRNNRQKTQEMFRYMDSGEAYIGLNNYQKAAEEYKEAGTLAKKFHLCGCNMARSGNKATEI